jgi:hypothetical protein
VKRTQFDRVRALKCIAEDYVGEVPRFDGREFQEVFRVSRGRFQRVMEDVAAPGNPFYFPRRRMATGDDEDASFAARLSLTLKSMACGVRLLKSLINGSFIPTEQQVWFGLVVDGLDSCSMVCPLARATQTLFCSHYCWTLCFFLGPFLGTF